MTLLDKNFDSSSNEYSTPKAATMKMHENHPTLT
jgi:hypothetical protein